MDAAAASRPRTRTSRCVSASSPRPSASATTSTTRRGSSDHFAFLRRRVPAVMISGTEVGAFHTYGDTPATVDPARLRASGEVVVQSVLEMAATRVRRLLVGRAARRVVRADGDRRVAHAARLRRAPARRRPRLSRSGARSFDGVKARSTSRTSRIPARGGRYSGSQGYLDAAQYVADQFKTIGLEPLGDGGTYFQRFSMPIVDLSATPTLARTGADAKSWKHRVDFTETVGGRSGNGTRRGAGRRGRRRGERQRPGRLRGRVDARPHRARHRSHLGSRGREFVRGRSDRRPRGRRRVDPLLVYPALLHRSDPGARDHRERGQRADRVRRARRWRRCKAPSVRGDRIRARRRRPSRRTSRCACRCRSRRSTTSRA